MAVSCNGGKMRNMDMQGYSTQALLRHNVRLRIDPDSKALCATTNGISVPCVITHNRRDNTISQAVLAAIVDHKSGPLGQTMCFVIAHARGCDSAQQIESYPIALQTLRAIQPCFDASVYLSAVAYALCHYNGGAVADRAIYKELEQLVQANTCITSAPIWVGSDAGYKIACAERQYTIQDIMSGSTRHVNNQRQQQRKNQLKQLRMKLQIE